ncbi:MAG: hypothetical protein J6R32_00345 [Bacteroidales bacterium]|nr:hypothetical protein [Bacteroidales bacterium]
MSATNHTTNYNLPQFIGTDKPTWLTDVNGALSAIDTQMKANADSASSASASATTANTSIGTLSELTTTAKTNLVGAINEVNTGISTAQNTANSAVSTASSANDKATLALSNTALFNLTSFVTTQASNFVNVSLFNSMSGSLTVATNTDGSIFKVYGNVAFSKDFGEGKFTIHSAVRPTSQFVISPVGFITEASGYIRPVDVTVKTNGDLEFSLYSGALTGTSMLLPACIYFAKDFGDTPTPNN